MHLLAVRRARRAGDVLIHQCAAEVVTARSEQLPGSAQSDLHPTRLDVVDPAVIGDPPHRVHQQRLSEGWAPAGLTLKIYRGGHMDERERHELGEPSGLLL